MDALERSILDVQLKIDGVVGEIAAVQSQLLNEKDPEQRKCLQQGQEHLQKREGQLREKELLLLSKVPPATSLQAARAHLVPTAAEILNELVTKVDIHIADARQIIGQLEDVPWIRGRPSLLLARLGTSFLTKHRDLSDLIDRSGLVSLVATSGSGKTRTLLELLSSRLGLYFVGNLVGNFGSADLKELEKLYLEDVAYDVRPGLVQSVVKAAVLARLFLLSRCLLANFSPREWLLFQLLGGIEFETDMPRHLTEILLGELQAVDVYTRQRALETGINKQWEQVEEKARGLVIVLDEAQALFAVHKDQFKPQEEGSRMRSSFHQVYEALKTPSSLFAPRFIVSATCLAIKREAEGSVSRVAKRLLHGPAFWNLGKFHDTNDMLVFIREYISPDQQVDEELLLKFRGRFRPLARAVEDCLEKGSSLTESLGQVRNLLTKEDVEGSYIRILKRIQVQPRIHNADLIGLCRMVCLTAMFSGRYNCTRKAEVELIHRGLAYLDTVDVDRGEYGLTGTVDEPLVLEGLREYFKDDNSLLHIMNLLNQQCEAAAPDVCRFAAGGESFNQHPIFSGVTLPKVFHQQLRLWSGDNVRLVGSKSMTSFLAGDMGSSTVLNPEFLAGPDLVVPLRTQDGSKFLLLAQFRLVNFLDKTKFEQGVSTTDPELLFRSRKAAKLKREFAEVGNSWWEKGVIRLMVVYPAVFKTAPMPPAVEVLPAAGGIGPQVKVIIHAGNAKLFFSNDLISFLDRFKGFKLGEPESVARSIGDRFLALELHRMLNGRPQRKRNFEAAFYRAEDNWGDDEGMELDI